jgi:hypothetical protein
VHLPGRHIHRLGKHLKIEATVRQAKLNYIAVGMTKVYPGYMQHHYLGIFPGSIGKRDANTATTSLPEILILKPARSKKSVCRKMLSTRQCARNTDFPLYSPIHADSLL